MQDWVFFSSLDNLLQKNVIVSFFGNQISNGAHLKKRAIFDLLFTFLVTRESYKNSFSTYLTHIHTRILLTLLTFMSYQFWKKYEFIRYGFSLVWVPVLILIRAILEQSITKWWVKFYLKCLLLICTYPNAKFIVICKTLTLNDGGEDSVKYRNRKKQRFLATILLFIGKIIITW